jgi:Fe-S cluster assembly iron-binding protein IscA
MSTQEGYLGIRERFITVEESVYGTNPGLSTAKVPGVDVIITPTFTQGFQEVKSSGTDNRTVDKKVAGPLSLAYSIVYYPTTWERLKYVFDIDSETGSGTYTHNLSVGNTIKSFSSEWAIRHDTDPLIFQITGNIINQYSISFTKSNGEGNDGFITCTENAIAQNYSTPTSVQAGTFTTSDEPFQYRHLDVIVDGDSLVEVNSGDLTFTQGINSSDSRYANTSLDRTIGTPIATVFRVSGRININLFKSDYNTLWEAADAISGVCSIAFTQSSGNKITFTLSGVTFEPAPIGATNIEGVNTGDLIFTANDVSVVAIDGVANW